MPIGAAKASELGDVPRRVTSGNEHYVMVPSQLLTQLAHCALDYAEMCGTIVVYIYIHWLCRICPQCLHWNRR